MQKLIIQETKRTKTQGRGQTVTSCLHLQDDLQHHPNKNTHTHITINTHQQDHQLKKVKQVTGKVNQMLRCGAGYSLEPSRHPPPHTRPSKIKDTGAPIRLRRCTWRVGGSLSLVYNLRLLL